MELSSGIEEEVERPAEELSQDHLAYKNDRSVLESFLELDLRLLCDPSNNSRQQTREISSTFSSLEALDLRFVLHLRQAKLFPCLGDEHFVSGHVTCAGMVTGVLISA